MFMIEHVLSQKEIQSIPAGRLMNTLVYEYALGKHPERWSNGEQKMLRCHWFESHPRSCAEDDGGHCSADEVPNFSTDHAAAFDLADRLKLSTAGLATKTSLDELHWATFSGVAYGDTDYGWKKVWASAETLPLAICRAALSWRSG